MPLSYEIDEELGLVRTSATGRVTLGELLAGLEELVLRPNLPLPLRELWDGSAIDDLGISPTDARRAISTLRTWPAFKGAHIALVSGDRDIVFGMSRLVEAVAYTSGADLEFRAFRDAAEAERWLVSVRSAALADTR